MLPANVAAQDSNTEAAKALGPIQGEIRFSWWGSQTRNEMTDQILKLFEAENPGVTVVREASDFNPHFDKLTIQAAAGNQPCTIQMQSRRLAPFAKPEVLMPLDDLLAKGVFNTKGISEATLKTAYGQDGHIYMIPSAVYFSSLMYNKTWLEKAGLQPPSADWKWSDLAQLARDIKPHLPEGAYPMHNLGNEPDSFLTWVQTEGYPLFDGSHLGFPKQVAIDRFNFWEDLRKEGLTEAPDVMVEENGSLVEESNIANGRTFLTARPANRLDVHQTTLDAVRPGEQLAIVRYPLGEDGTSGQDTGSNGIAIGATCPPELLPAAVAWVNFFTEDARAAAIYKSNNGVVAIDQFAETQYNDPNTTRGQKEQIALFRELANVFKPIIYPNNGYNAINEAMPRAYQAVAFEQMTAEEAADQFFADAEAILAK
jgi:multiple sugar transport system substrate-binding protein